MISQLQVQGMSRVCSPSQIAEHRRGARKTASDCARAAPGMRDKHDEGGTEPFMRSSKSRSRGNKNRNRPSGGNIINRVFDSSGPDGKVRGTPQQIIDKYNQLHRDAVLSGDRVDAENYAQHAEHYLRMLAEAQREVEAKREEQERQNRERQAERDRERAERLKAQEDSSSGRGGGDRGGRGDAGGARSKDDAAPDDLEIGSVAFLQADQGDTADTGLVETPESKSDEGEPEAAAPPAEKPRRPRRPRKKPDAADGDDDQPTAAE